VEAIGSADDGKKIVTQMESAPLSDPLFGTTTIRHDGRALHNMYLFQVKKPEESKGPYDYYKLVSTIPPEEAFRAMEEGGCPLLKEGRQ
jgi:branched-chain amino acid transport system substrate-binding protein